MSPLHLSEAAFRLTAAMESLLTGGDGGHAEVDSAALLPGVTALRRHGVRSPVQKPTRRALSRLWMRSASPPAELRSRVEVGRKVQQRAAMLVGADDDDRLQVRNTAGAGYAARSAYAHGAKDKQSDLHTMRSVVRRVLTHWVVQAAYCTRLSGRHGGRDGLVNLLDDALFSHRLHQEHIIGPRNAFRADGGTPPLPPVAPWDPGPLAGPSPSPLDLA